MNRSPVRDYVGGSSEVADLGRRFEAAFLAEMLKHSGLTDSLGRISGGGSDGFSDLMVREIADEIARTRPIGIGEALARRHAGHE